MKCKRKANTSTTFLEHAKSGESRHPTISGGCTGGQGGHGPPEVFLTPLLDPTFLERYAILNILFTANTRKLERCTRNGHDTSRLVLLTYKKRFSSFLCFEICGKFQNVNGDLELVFSVVLSSCTLISL